MKNPLVSVIIPVYNGERTLRNCLISVLNQDYKNYEVIIVNNNSTDNTKKIIEEFQKKTDKIKYFFEPKVGRGAARNLGIEKAKGKVIAMTDSDCIVPESWIEEITKPILEGKENVVMGFEEDLVNNYWTGNIQEETEKSRKSYILNGYINTLDTKNFAIKSPLIKRLKFDSELKNCEDFDLGIRILEIKKIRFIPEIKGGHYHKSSFKSILRLNFNRGFWIFKIYEKRRKNNNSIKEPAFDIAKTKVIFAFPVFLVSIFRKNDFKKAFFLLIWNSSWALGFLAGRIHSIFKYKK